MFFLILLSIFGLQAIKGYNIVNIYKMILKIYTLKDSHSPHIGKIYMYPLARYT